jgi:hypothetical protein
VLTIATVAMLRSSAYRGRAGDPRDLGGLPSTPCGTHLSTDARANSEAAMTRTPRLFRTAGPPATLWRGAAIVTLLALGSLPAAALSAGSSKAPKLRSKAPCSTPQTLPTSVAGTPGAFAIVASTGHVGCNRPACDGSHRALGDRVGNKCGDGTRCAAGHASNQLRQRRAYDWHNVEMRPPDTDVYGHRDTR